MALKSANQAIRWLQRIGIFGWHGTKYAESKLFDEFVYGAVSTWAILKFGPQLGACVTFLIMAPISALFCTLYLHLYDRVKTDLFGFEMIKGIRDGTAITGWWRPLLHRIIRWGDIPAFIVLNCFLPNGDPFMATVYLRKGAEQYNGLSRQDWDIFWASVLVSNAWWSFRWAVIVVFFKELIWPFLIQPSLHWLGLA